MVVSADTTVVDVYGTDATDLVAKLQADGWPIPPALVRRRRPRLGNLHPAVSAAAAAVYRTRHRLRWATSGSRWATERDETRLGTRITRHNSLLLRQLGESDMWMQHNKVTNLKIAAALTDGLVIRPGETFSFCRTVGRTSSKRGFVDGMLLSNGKAVGGMGGGICQLANLLHWMVLHSPLTVTQRSEHGFDPFPDNNRVIPWGTGAAIYYNYVDLAFRNDTDATFQLITRVGPRYLEGELLADRELPHSYRVHARDEEFLRIDGHWFRRNEIWRRVIDRRTGNDVGDELVRRNLALVTYTPAPFRQDGDPEPTGPLGEPIPVRAPHTSSGAARPDTPADHGGDHPADRDVDAAPISTP